VPPDHPITYDAPRAPLEPLMSTSPDQPTESSLGAPLLAALLAPDSALRAQLTSLAVDTLLSRKLNEVLDPTAAADLIAQALSPQPVAYVTARHLWPLWERLRARAQSEAFTVGAHLPADLPDALTALLAAARWPSAPWLSQALDPAPLRALLAPVVQQVLISFTRKLPGLGGVGAAPSPEHSGGGLMGMLRKQAGEQAKRLLDASRSVADKLGLGEERLAQLTHDFTQQAIDESRDALSARLATAEGRDLLSQLQRHALRRLFDDPAAAVLTDLDAFPHADLDALLAHLSSSLSQDPWWRQVLLDTLTDLLSCDGDRPLSAWLSDAGLLDATRAALSPPADTLALALFSHEGFSQWLSQALSLL
jgi:hypothetical protein